MGGPPGEREVGIRGQEVVGIGKFFEEQGFLGSVRTTKSDQGVGAWEVSADKASRFLIKTLNGRAMKKGGAGEVDFLPKSAEGGGGIQSGSGEFGRHGLP